MPIDAGRSRAISRSVASWKITYGGTPRARAMSSRTTRSRSNSVRSTSSHDSDSARDRLRASPFFGHALPRERKPRDARFILEQLDALSPSPATPDTHRRSAAAGRGRSAARCSRAPRRPTRPASRPNVLSLSCARATTCSLAWPRSTLGDVRGAESLARRGRRTRGSSARGRRARVRPRARPGTRRTRRSRPSRTDRRSTR